VGEEDWNKDESCLGVLEVADDMLPSPYKDGYSEENNDAGPEPVLRIVNSSQQPWTYSTLIAVKTTYKIDLMQKKRKGQTQFQQKKS
jgi:hypothetical protein